VDDDNANIRILNDPTDHSHYSDDENMIRADAFREAIKSNVKDDPSRPVKRVYDATASSVARLGRAVPSEFKTVKSSAKRAKQGEVPRIPRTVNDIDIRGVWAQTWNVDDFLLHWDSGWGLLMFATEENLKVLQECRDIYIDGTFRTTPKPFYQYVSIHGHYRGRVLPLVHCLVVGKTVGHYRQIIINLKLNVRNLVGRPFSPKRVMCDFEQAIISAIETDLPRSKICACSFHFRQSLYRHIHRLGKLYYFSSLVFLSSDG
jgi:hypothetical protein